MKNLQEITLSNGTLLRIEDGMVACWDSDHARIDLTRGQNDIVYKLARNLNHPLSMNQLYESYSGDDASIDNKGISNKVHKMKRSLPECIRDTIKSVRGYGYQLDGTLGWNANHDSSSNFVGLKVVSEIQFGRVSDLAGDYYGYYLDPLGTGAVLGAYIHIENAGSALEPQLDAYSVLGIRSEYVLLGDNISEIFKNKGKNYKERFKLFKKGLNVNDQRCSWWQGNVNADGTLAIIDLLKSDTGAKWKIILDIKEYIRCRRDREREDDYYRGGLGLVLATRTLHGTACFRLGLIRKTFIKQAISMNNEDMKSRLKLLDDSKEAMWKPLKLSGWLDKHWYDWIMTE